MSKFNATVKKTPVLNRAGGMSYRQSDKVKFASHVLTSFVQDEFYRSEKDGLKELKAMIDGLSDKSFVAKTAVYARNAFGMRSVSHVVAGEIAKSVKGESWTKDFFNAVVRRPDDITETLSYYMGNYGKPLPNALKKGLAKSFGKFDGYQIGKYRGEGKGLSLVDAVNLVRPRSTEKNQEALRELVNGSLRSTGTWEASLTKAGQNASSAEEKAELKKQSWMELLESRKLGYFAALRNVRNILEQAPEGLDMLCDLLTDRKAIKKSLVLPFRYQTAIEEVSKLNVDGVRQAVRALSKAVEISLDNVPQFEGRTLVVIDSSGSMMGGGWYNREPDSKSPIRIASLFGGALVKSNDCDLMLFDGSARYVNVNTMDSLSTIQRGIFDQCTGGSTNFHAPFEEARKAYDRIIILSDMQGWVDSGWGMTKPQATFEKYKKKFDCTPFVYSFDLRGYGSLQLPEDKVFCLAGFSEKIFDIMKLLETDRNALVKKIEAVTF